MVVLFGLAGELDLRHQNQVQNRAENANSCENKIEDLETLEGVILDDHEDNEGNKEHHEVSDVGEGSSEVNEPIALSKP